LPHSLQESCPICVERHYKCRRRVIKALLQSEWVLFCLGGPKAPCFQGEKLISHGSKTCRAVSHGRENKSCCCSSRDSGSTTTSFPANSRCVTRAQRRPPGRNQHRDVEEPQKLPTRFGEEPKNSLRKTRKRRHSICKP